MTDSTPIGLIAGNGRFPLLVAQAARAEGKKIVAVAHLGETRPELASAVDVIHWVRLGELGKLIRVFRNEAVTRVIMAGGVDKKKMFSRARPDWMGLKLLARMTQRRDDLILRTVADELEKEGLRVLPSTTLLPSLLAPAGTLSRRQPTEEEEKDIAFGWPLAKELGRLDIGQCLVVRKGAVVAVEAIEGTDATILRGGQLAREKAVVIKVSKPTQDLRFDLPAIGEQTIQTMQEVKAAVLAIEAQKTLIFDREAIPWIEP
ncbi:MAG: UDP-2,3-diacylglucosamine diphosphatase LpxI [Desulfobacterota bacterium]|nr:UDP-2,3-diacylglucosamine diphosphatase LpxI [Thermodesulfobacteriota bacterium]